MHPKSSDGTRKPSKYGNILWKFKEALTCTIIRVLWILRYSFFEKHILRYSTGTSFANRHASTGLSDTIRGWDMALRRLSVPAYAFGETDLPSAKQQKQLCCVQEHSTVRHNRIQPANALSLLRWHLVSPCNQKQTRVTKLTNPTARKIPLPRQMVMAGTGIQFTKIWQCKIYHPPQQDNKLFRKYIYLHFNFI